MFSVRLWLWCVYAMVAVSNVYAMNYSKASDPLCVLRQLINNDDACEIKTLLQSYNLNSHDPLIPEVALYFSVMFKNVGFAKALSGAGTYVGKRRGVVTQSPLLLVFDTFDNKKAQSLYLPFFIDSIEMNLKKEFFGDSKSGEKISSNLLKSVHVGSLQSDNYYCSLWSRLMYSAYYGYCDVILFFINHQEYFPTNVLGIDEWWDTVARLAVYNEDKRLIDALVDADMIKLSGVLHQSKMLLNFLGCPIC